MDRTTRSLLAIGVLLIMVGCANSGVGNFLTDTLHLESLWQFLLGAAAALVVGLIVGVQPILALLIGITATGATIATAPKPPPQTVVNNTGKGKVNVNGSQAPSGFLGLPAFWWGVIAVAVGFLLIRNRVHIMALATGRVPRGERLSTVLGMFVGGNDTRPPQPPAVTG